jgi:cysteinyl-tRNA synthetase
MLTPQLTRGANFIIDRLNSHGKRADIVGGSVRDFLLGKEADDFDITTNATPEELVEYFETVMPDYDRERVYLTHIKKIYSWYNILVANEVVDFCQDDEAVEEEAAAKTAVSDDPFIREIEEKIAARAEAKKAKNYALADSIRAELLEKGVTLIDTAQGTKYQIG